VLFRESRVPPETRNVLLWFRHPAPDRPAMNLPLEPEGELPQPEGPGEIQ
jgi:hypothetical protein